MFFLLLLARRPSRASRKHYWVCKFLVTFGFIKLKFISGHSTIIECRGGADDAAARRAVRAARPECVIKIDRRVSHGKLRQKTGGEGVTGARGVDEGVWF